MFVAGASAQVLEARESHSRDAAGIRAGDVPCGTSRGPDQRVRSLAADDALNVAEPARSRCRARCQIDGDRRRVGGIVQRVRDVPPPEMVPASVAPLAKSNESAPAPPARFSKLVKATPATVPAFAPVMFQVRAGCRADERVGALPSDDALDAADPARAGRRVCFSQIYGHRRRGCDMPE